MCISLRLRAFSFVKVRHKVLVLVYDGCSTIAQYQTTRTRAVVYRPELDGNRQDHVPGLSIPGNGATEASRKC
jgi:hypothetical protein